MQDKVRVYALARELDMESKDLLDLCRQHGIDIKNQLSSIDLDQRQAIIELVKRGGNAAAAPKPQPTIPPVLQPQRVPVLNRAPGRREPEPPSPRPAVTAVPEPVREVVPSVAPPAVPPAAPVTEPKPEIPLQPAARAPELEIKPQTQPLAPEVRKPVEPTVPPPAAPRPQAAPVTPAPAVRPPLGGSKMRDLSQPRTEGNRPRRQREVPRPSAVRVVSRTPSKQAPAAKKPEKPQEPVAQKPIQRLTTEMLTKPVNTQEILNKVLAPTVTPPTVEVEDEEGEAGKNKSRPGLVKGRDARHQQRNARAQARKGREGEAGGTRALLSTEDDRPQRVKDRLRKAKQKKGGPTQPRKGKVPVAMPITVRSLSEALGIRSGDVLMKLMTHGAPPTININSIVEPAMAEMIALDVGAELDIKRAADAEEQLAAAQPPDTPEDLVPRAPIVTIMGHVDHGKTSLLDRIRESNVVDTEAGGITQVIRAWRVEHDGKPITFLDTPGHEAFTKMRARGAQVTDIAVIVVAADDGVMPQTEEAISHAKAAGVSLVVAINKVDLPNANLNKTKQQLYGLNVLPDNMGGDTPFVETSAATGKGIDELLEAISVVAELKELKANPNKPGSGTCLEAMLSEGEGVLATLLVREGTLRRGDVIVCGGSYGRVRQMYNDLGKPLDEAGPSVPVRITGLDTVPNADDPFQATPELTVAREIAEKRTQRQQEASLVKREPMKLEKLGEAKIDELKVIVKADFRGSIEAIKKELEKLQHDEVRVRLLHAAIGGITESDVQLALTSPEDTIIVGFNVVPDDRARQLADERGVQVREYDIIYNLTDDIKAALQGKLKPKEEIVHLGRAVVRDTFKISRVGTIAGCYVTQGTIERSAKIRLIREGVVIYPPPDRTASLDSLKRFKDDAREVREGFECGLKIAGYDDVKVGDVIEAYRVEQVQRTL